MLGWFKRKGDPKEELQKVLGEFELPSFPAIILDALQLLRSSDSSLSEVADKLASDPGITVKLLGVSNSAAFALRREVKSVNHAVTLQGRSALESILLGLAVSKSMPTQKIPGLNLGQFWRACALRAIAARAIAQTLHPATRSESFTAALLQDMAIPILLNVRSEEYQALNAVVEAEQLPLYELERNKFGWDHGTVAGWMCESWGFPSAMTNAIGSHHEATEHAETPLAVALVSRLDGSEERNAELSAELSDKFGMKPTAAAKLLASAEEQSSELAALFAR